MSFWVAFLTALSAIRKNALRSFLATVGITIAVAAVVTTVSVGRGMQIDVARRMRSLGTNLLFVTPGTRKSHGSTPGATVGRPLTMEDGVAIADELEPLLLAWAPLYRTSVEVVRHNRSFNASLVGTHRDYLVARAWHLSEGSMFSQEQQDVGAKVCVIGANVRERLFGGLVVPVVGSVMRVRQTPCVISGVLAKKGSGGFGDNQDDMILMPFKAMIRRVLPMKGSKGLALTLAAKNAEQSGQLESEVRKLLHQRHRVGVGQDDDFAVYNLSEIQRSASEQAKTVSLAILAIACVSLWVGAIGVANVMLVSVTERTREIGIRMAIGAKRRDILRQFLAEAVVLNVLGGCVGCGLGALLSKAVTVWAGWRLDINVSLVAVAVGVAACTGVASGFFPAWRASRMDPIEALRRES